MMIHEGIPGHHLQLATASTHPSIVRRHFEAMEHAEGWTTMLEDYMLDQGYMGELTDEARFSGKRDISRLGARTAIDLFFMSGNKDFLDLGLFKTRFFSTDPDADLNGDGIADFLDLGVLKTLFFQSPGPSGLPCAGTVPCPEPLP